MDNSDSPERRKNNKTDKLRQKRRSAYKWALTVTLMSFVITAVLSFVSEELISVFPIWAAILVLVLFITLGIVFDVIGLAVATADISMFNSMAARKVNAGKKAVWLISNAEKVTSFCNDVVGDIAGIVSGATGAAIAVILFISVKGAVWYNLMLTSLIAALTVGGKAIGKQFAMTKSNKIVLVVARIMCGFRQ